MTKIAKKPKKTNTNNKKSKTKITTKKINHYAEMNQWKVKKN